MELYEYLPENLELEDKVLTDLTALTINKYRKIKRKNTAKRLATLAASIAIIIAVMWAIGFENVAAAAQRLFSFIPGFGITEQVEEPVYILKDTVVYENETAKVTLYHASSIGYANTESLYFDLDIEMKNAQMSELYDLVFNLDASIKRKNEVFANEEYTNKGNFTIDGNLLSINGLKVDIPLDKLTENKKYELILASDNFSANIPFKLKSATTSDDVVLASQMVKDLNITAVKYPQVIDGIEYIAVDVAVKGDLNVTYDLPPIYQNVNADIYFEDENGNKLQPLRNVGNTYYFTSDSVSKDSILVISNIRCNEMKEDIILNMEIPKAGETQDIYVEIPFENVRVLLTEAYKEDYLYVKAVTEISENVKDFYFAVNSKDNVELQFTDLSYSLLRAEISPSDTVINFNSALVSYTIIEPVRIIFN